METIVIQTKIEKLYHTTHALRHIGDGTDYTNANSLMQLNKDIHDLIDELYSVRGNTVEQEATLCLAILLGYSVSINAHLTDDVKKQRILERSYHVLDRLSSSLLKCRLSSLCITLTNNYI